METEAAVDQLCARIEALRATERDLEARVEQLRATFAQLQDQAEASARLSMSFAETTFYLIRQRYLMGQAV